MIQTCTTCKHVHESAQTNRCSSCWSASTGKYMNWEKEPDPMKRISKQEGIDTL